MSLELDRAERWKALAAEAIVVANELTDPEARQSCSLLPLDTKARQLAVLMTVAQHEGLSQTDLVNRTGVDRSTMADLVVRLKRKGLIQRRRTKEDARAYAVNLTDEGRQVLHTAAPLAKRVDRRVLDALPGSRREEFMSALASIVSALEPRPEDKH